MELGACLSRNRYNIIRQWAEKLHTEGGETYRHRPLEELLRTTTEATDAYYAVLVARDYAPIRVFIDRVTRMRFVQFSMADVQTAFEMYREILLPLLLGDLDAELHLSALQDLNRCLSFTIQKFTEFFHLLHEQQLKAYANNLEALVERRTKELADSEANYRVLVEEINDGYFVNQNGYIVFANKTYCAMHGLTYEETIGKHYTEFISPKSVAEVVHIYEKRLQGHDSPDMYVYYRRHKDGKSYPTENKVTIITYGGQQAAAGICRDITTRMEMEERVRTAERLAHIGQLTASLAHEIRNPLSSLKINIDKLVHKLDLAGHDKRRMEIMAIEIARLEKILEEMLDFSRPLRLDLKTTRIPAVIEACLTVLEPRIREKDLGLRTRYAAPLPAIFADPDKLEAVIINGLLNAIAMTPPGGSVEIAAGLRDPQDGFLTIEIADDGQGVRNEDLPFVFDPFFSLRPSGTGIGLANIKKIVEAHQGTVALTPRTPKGACLVIRLPLRPHDG